MRSSPSACQLLAVLALGLAGCDPCGCQGNPRAYDSYPIDVDLTTGPLLVSVAERADTSPRLGVIDLLSPITTVDSIGAGCPTSTPHQRCTDLSLYSTVAKTATVARTRFDDVLIFDLHPCDSPGPCSVGTDAAPTEITSVIGADILSGRAARIDFAASTLTFFPDISGTDAIRGAVCDAVFPAPFAGGGTLLLGGGEVDFSGRRISTGACLAFDAEALTETDRGVDMRLVISTGMGPSIISTSAYERYRAFCASHTCADPGAVSSLPTAQIYLPSGPIDGRVTTLSDIALVGEAGEERGPCKELHANHLLTRNNCGQESCPCPDGESFCPTAAAVEMRRTLEVAVVPDDTPLLQALRVELRPEFPEVDGILGTSALNMLSLDVDYPNNRLVMRCATDDVNICVARPEVRAQTTPATIAQSCPHIPL